MAATKTKRQPVDNQLRHGYLTHRDAIWAAIRILREFSVSEIEDQTRINQSTIKTYVRGLTNANYLERIECHPRTKGDTRYVENRWRLVNNVGVDAPRVTREGKPVTQGQSRENMWRTMRIIGEFSVRELAIQATTEGVNVKPSDAKDYVKYLHKAGYLQITRPAQPGNKSGMGTQARYRFIKFRYTGPRPPMVQRTKQVFDPNVGTVVWPRSDDS